MKAALVGVSLLVAVSAMARPTPVQKCTAGKYLATTQYALCRAHAEKSLFLHGDQARYARALSRCANKLSESFQRLDEKALKKSSRCTSGLGDISVKELVDVYLQDVGWRVALLPFRFVNNGDGTVTDHHSGLTWEMKVFGEDPPDFSNLHAVLADYPWSGRCESNLDKLCQPTAAAAAACALGAQGGALGCEQCDEAVEGLCTWVGPPGQVTIWEWLVALNGADFAGHNDWRIPTASDFLTILDQQTYPALSAPFMGSNCGPACTDLNDPACGCKGTYYFTAATILPMPSNAWAADLDYGNLLVANKINFYNARAVRGP